MSQALSLIQDTDFVLDLDAHVMMSELALCAAVDDFIEGRTDVVPLDADYALPEGTAAAQALILRSVDADPDDVDVDLSALDQDDLNDDRFSAPASRRFFHGELA